MIRNRRRQEEGVELNLAAMLDMAFQLLTFFILTFSPVSQETGFHFHMPPPMPVAGPPGPSTRPGDNRAAADLGPLETLTVSVLASPDGHIRQIAIEDTVVGQRDLAERLRAIFADRVAGFQQVLLQVDSRLAYGELMQVIDICSRIRLPTEARVQKLSFVELPVGPGQ
jgi:biopolymer transport protein ExbD